MADIFQAEGIDPHGGSSPSYGQQVLGTFKTAGEYAAQPAVQLSNLINKGLMSIPGMQHLPGAVKQKMLGQLPGPEAPQGLGGKIAAGIGTALPYALAGPESLAFKGLSALGKGIGSLTAGAGIGALQSPQAPMTGALAGGTASMLPQAAGKAVSAAPKFLEKLSQQFPKKMAKSILNELGQGRGIEENAKSVAKDIYDAANHRVAQSSENYGNILSKVGNNKIYKYRMPKKGFLGLDADLLAKSPKSLQRVNAAFLKAPTFENAHTLQSELGSEAYHVGDPRNLSIADKNTVRDWKDARTSLKNDMVKYLNRRDKGGQLATEYRAASDFHKNEVQPYRDNKQISDISRGAVTNPRNLSTIFKNPESDTLKVMKDLGPEANNKIVYGELGKLKGKLTPKALVKAHNTLDQKGLSSYVSDSLEGQMTTLKRRMLGTKAAKLLGIEELLRRTTRPLRRAI